MALRKLRQSFPVDISDYMAKHSGPRRLSSTWREFDPDTALYGIYITWFFLYGSDADI